MNQEKLYKETREPKPEEAIAKGNDNKFHDNSAAYTWNNEPASRLIDIVKNLEGKRGFGVVASGDQPFILLEQGLEAYLGFDISQVACFWNELKVAAVLNLSREEFRNFTIGENNHIREENKKINTNISLYDNLRKYLTVYAQKFFDKVIKDKYDKNCIKSLLTDSRYFRGGSFCFNENETPYAQKESEYRKLQKSLQDSPYKFTWQSLTSATELVPEEEFDIIFISNILDRWDQFGGDFTEAVIKMKNLLKKEPEAMIIGNYQWSSGVDDHLKPVAQKLDMKFIPHHKVNSNYWVLQHAL